MFSSFSRAARTWISKHQGEAQTLRNIVGEEVFRTGARVMLAPNEQCQFGARTRALASRTKFSSLSGLRGRGEETKKDIDGRNWEQKKVCRKDSQDRQAGLLADELVSYIGWLACFVLCWWTCLMFVFGKVVDGLVIDHKLSYCNNSSFTTVVY